MRAAGRSPSPKPPLSAARAPCAAHPSPKPAAANNNFGPSCYCYPGMRASKRTNGRAHVTSLEGGSGTRDDHTPSHILFLNTSTPHPPPLHSTPPHHHHIYYFNFSTANPSRRPRRTIIQTVNCCVDEFPFLTGWSGGSPLLPARLQPRSRCREKGRVTGACFARGKSI